MVEVVEYCVMAELAEQVDLRTFASARDFSTAHLVICAEQRVRVFITWNLCTSRMLI